MKKFLTLCCFLTVVFFALPAFADTAWRFAVVGDTQGGDDGINAKIVREIARSIIKDGPACVLVPGDLVRGEPNARELEDQLRAWRREFMEPLRGKGIAVYPVRGNHETTEDGNDLLVWNRVFSGPYALPVNGPRGETKTTYSFTVNNAFFAGMEIYGRGRARVMNLQWLEKQLKADPRQHIFVFAHEPLYMTGKTNTYADAAQLAADRNAIARMMTSAGDASYFCGHDHWFNHAAVEVFPGKLLHQFIVGTGGGPLGHWLKGYRDRGVTAIAHEENYGYLLVTVDGNTVTLTMKTRAPDGTYLPGETYTCSKSE